MYLDPPRTDQGIIYSVNVSPPQLSHKSCALQRSPTEDVLETADMLKRTETKDPE